MVVTAAVLKARRLIHADDNAKLAGHAEGNGTHESTIFHQVASRTSGTSREGVIGTWSHIPMSQPIGSYPVWELGGLTGDKAQFWHTRQNLRDESAPEFACFHSRQFRFYSARALLGVHKISNPPPSAEAIIRTRPSEKEPVRVCR